MIDSIIVSQDEFNCQFPELEGVITSPIQYTFYYKMAWAMYCGFEAFCDEEARKCALSLAIAHIAYLICEGPHPIKELKTMQSAEKYEVTKSDAQDFSLDKSTYGLLLKDWAFLSYGGALTVSYREEVPKYAQGSIIQQTA